MILKEYETFMKSSKSYIENEYLAQMNVLCEKKLQNGDFARYMNEVEYDPHKEILTINTLIIPTSSIKSITIKLTPDMITGDFDNAMNNLNKEIEQKYGN